MSQTRSEVVYRRCNTVHQAVNVAMEYERAHATQIHGARGFSRSLYPRTRDTENRGSSGFGRSSNRVPARESQPEPMDIGFSRMISRDECQRRNLCFFCKEPGHRMAQCQKRNGHRGPPHHQQRQQQQSYQREHDGRPRRGAAVIPEVSHRVHAYEEKESEAKPELFEQLTINTAGLGNQTEEVGADRFHQLLIKTGTVNGKSVKVLLDSGADHNVIRKGLATQVLRRKKAVVERIDGPVTSPQWINEVKADMTLEGFVLNDMLFWEWDLPATHDIILGKPWFSRFNPLIDWRTHEVTLDFDLLDPYWLIEADERLFQLEEEMEAAGRTICSDGVAKPVEPDEDGANGSGMGLASTPVGALDQATKLPSSPITRLLQD
ncbi:unnamed protein product [Phytophthora fragariaefolia]|uniref:Unnamed protein product n=1 Tax=Phytophthora fragariaefolia TaxID=1490495 RepID=A0A9W6Y3P0_9STRA|nr:unnamed protein product [Phytophthora fragariaefolia]